MYMNRKEAQRAVEAVLNTEQCVQKLQTYLEMFAHGDLSRDRMGLYLECLLDNAHDKVLESTAQRDEDAPPGAA